MAMPLATPLARRALREACARTLSSTHHCPPCGLARGGTSNSTSTSTSTSSSRRALATMSGAMEPPLAIGALPLPHEEAAAETELLAMLPEFQLAMRVLHSDADDGSAPLANTARAAQALLPLKRTAEIARSAMGLQSVYVMAALRHLAVTYALAGDHAMATKTMLERGELMQWPLTEQERMLRLFLRQNEPTRALEWCETETFTALFPQDDTLPLKWGMYERVANLLRDGVSHLNVVEPSFVEAVELLRSHTPDKQATATPAQRETPFVMAQYAALSFVASGALHTDYAALTDAQVASLAQAEELWRDALKWVDHTTTTVEKKKMDGGSDTGSDSDSDSPALGVDAPFEAWVQTNLGELLLRSKRYDEGMALLGQALQTQQRRPPGNALALTRVLGQIARGCHAMGQAVSSEGLYTSVLDAFEKEATLSLTDQVEHARVLRGYGALLQDWEKREKDAEQKHARAEALERAVAQQCQQMSSQEPLEPTFYLPL